MKQSVGLALIAFVLMILASNKLFPHAETMSHVAYSSLVALGVFLATS